MNFIYIPTHHTLVTLEKIDVSPDPISLPTPWDEWIPGRLHNQTSLPISYSLRGYLMAPIRYGYPMEVFRIQRNGVESFGIFHSTPVVDIREGGCVETYNSIYRVSYEAELKKEAR